MSINFKDTENGNSTTGTISVVVPQAIAVGDLLEAQLFWNGITTAKLTPAISDNVNAGAWNIPAALSYYGDPSDGVDYTIQQQICWIRCDTAAAAGSCVVESSSLGTQGTNMVIVHHTGFATGNPELVPSDCSVNTGYSTSPAATGVTNAVANELSVVMAACVQGQNFSSVTGSFTGRAGFGSGTADLAVGDVVSATSGNDLTFGATIAEATWVVMIASFQDSATGAELSGTAANVTSATGAISAAVKLATAAADATSAAAALMVRAALTAIATDADSASGVMTAYAVITLEAPLYTGTGSIFDPSGMPWSNGAPVSGSVVYYDPTYVTIESNGEIFSTSQNCTFLAQWNNGGTWSDRIFTITGQIVGPAFDATSATGLLTASAALASAATNATTAVGLLVTRTALAAAALDSTAGSGLLTVNAALASAAADVTTATGALTVKAALLAAALDTTTATGALNAPTLAGAATDATSAAASLTARVPLAGAASDLTGALGALTAHVALLASAIDSTGASGSLLTGPNLAGAATDATAAAAALSVRALLAGAAVDLTTAGAAITTQWGLLGNAVDTTVASANLLQSNIGLYAQDPEYTASDVEIFGVYRFLPLGPTEARVLTFEFCHLLFNGELLASVPTIDVVTSAGTDATPTDILNGIPSLDETLTKVMQPINCANGVIGNNYYMVVTVNTTNPQKVLARYGLISIHP